MNEAALDEAKWLRLRGEWVAVVSPGSQREVAAEPYCAGAIRFVGTEITPGIYAVYFPLTRSLEQWLESLPLAN